MSEEDVRQMVRDRCTQRGGAARLARQAGVTPARVSQFLGGSSGPGIPILKALGLRKTIAYEKEACNPQISGA